ncbi:signal recognition particle protein Srp19 [Thermosphaera chiliense]|uniref:Signal recognition particle 19 kDa protein n=1 Tax=Thermosphaera chiliense TaxID=3402707 RepID=A0A7M1UT60_9CREN|nr:signal recognition particle protein Srp19 [Thermosphaera aggregans]QOR94312.1 signal recognition particle protein Srp19 [Thermosphaera aggregans]
MSREYRGRKTILYPAYIDSTLSRSEGRRIPSSSAVPSPSIEEIYNAAAKLGLNPVVENDKAYPGRWWVKGRVVVDKKYGKIDLLKKIAAEIKESRARKH